MRTTRRIASPRAPWLFLLLLAAVTAPIHSEQPSDTVLIRLKPSFDLRISESYTGIYRDGGGANLAVGVTMPFFRPLAVLVDLGYHYIPVITTGTTDPFSLSLLSAELSFQLRWVLWSKVEVSLGLESGYFYGFITEDPSATGQGIVWGYSAAVSYIITPGFSLGVSCRQNTYLGLDGHLALGVVIGVGL